jgi:hypothetical protein
MKKILFLAALNIMLIPAIVKGQQQQSCNLQIGDTYAGGIVFFLVSGNNGCHGLVCAPYDQSRDMIWTEADTLCQSLRIKNYPDWRLPNMYELDQIYTNLYKAGLGGFSKGYYWSSSEYRRFYAWDLDFANGQKYTSGKMTKGYVRAIRAF